MWISLGCLALLLVAYPGGRRLAAEGPDAAGSGVT
jgi:hypothetical protein